MLRRPKVGETEEDLLREEEEFLKQSGKEPPRKRPHEVGESEAKSSDLPDFLVGDIVERNRRVLKPPSANTGQPEGFPALFCIDPCIAPNKKEKKSLFALHMEEKKKKKKKKAEQMNVSSGPDEEQTKTHEEMDCEQSTNVTPDPSTSSLSSEAKQSIHEENVQKLMQMSEEEIIEAQKKLYETLDPKLISLLKNRGKSRKSGGVQNVAAETEDVEMNDAEEEIKVKEVLSTYVGEKWINMDFVEKDKLEWVGDIPDSKCLEPDQPYSARFDFAGELQPFSSKDIDVTKALYHHGEEPERPGYTIQELYQLSRSTVLQQRVLAINTIANIIRKTKLGYYDVCFDGHLLHKLIESDLFLLLRFSIDENALVPPVINCLRRLMYDDTDEYCLDKLLGVSDDDGDEQPLLSDETDETSEEEEKELKDNAIIDSDLIKGVLRTDLLLRMSYILNNLPCDRETITNAILCFIRISRHSVNACEQISTTSNILSFVYSVVKCDNPIYQGVKLFRLLVDRSTGELAADIANKFPMSFLLSFVNAETMTEIDKRDFYLLKLESLHLWRNFLKRDLMIDDFQSWTPCFLRLLRFYVEKVDLCGEGDFDFELFSAMLSLLTLAVRKKLRIDSNYVAVMYVCLEKWLKQLAHFDKFNYAGLKALGTCFRFFVRYFEVFQTDQTSLRFIRKIDSVILTLLRSSLFEKMSHNLIAFSHVLNLAATVKRDPKNLPSLSSVYKEGRDFVKIVYDNSPVAFFVPFVKYLKCSYSVAHSCRDSAEAFLSSANVRKYLTKVVGASKRVDNWFARHEISLLTDILDLGRTIGDAAIAKHSFRVLAMARSDDVNVRSLLSVATDRRVWTANADEFPDGLFDVYLESVYKPRVRSRYEGELVGDDWMFRILAELRGREAVAEVARALRFASFVSEACPEMLERVSYDVRYYNLCAVFMTDANVFDDDVQRELKVNLRAVLENRDKVRLEKKIGKKKSFYDLYTELVTQYAGVSYGLGIFAEFVLFPLQNKFDVSYRKLVWFEYLHVLRVVTLPYPATDFLDVEDFARPRETDESLLVTYLDSVSNGVILRARNPFVYWIAVTNVARYIASAESDPKLAAFLAQKLESAKNERIRRDVEEVGGSG